MRVRLLLSLLGLSFGSSVLLISLFSATQVSSNGGQAASQSKLYFSQQILPDHSFYKVLMAMDRLQLETASPLEQIFMKVEYANRRLDYANALLDKDEEEVAFSTLLKAQNYLNQAAVDSLKETVPTSVRDRVAKAIAYHSSELNKIASRLTDAHRAQLDSILSEHENLIKQLHNAGVQN